LASRRSRQPVRAAPPGRPNRQDPVMRLLLPIVLLTLLLGCLLPAGPVRGAPLIPPLKVDILDAVEKKQGLARVYPNFIELEDLSGSLRGAIGVVMVQGRVQLFLVRADEERRFIGWAENYRIFNTEDQPVGYYYWTPIWSYVYDLKMKKIGQAQCLAYQGVCAAGIAGYLLGLL